jgi:uncharacterized damage-inducible protein DinB
LNVALLRQGAELLESLDDAHFTRIGRQIRHGLDFYACFLRGLPAGRIDYVHRERSGRIETDRRFALDELRSTIDALESIDVAACAPSLDVRAEEGTDWAGSTPAREAQFLVSHTIHHQAIIGVLLSIHGHSLPERFGHSPSMWREPHSP